MILKKLLFTEKNFSIKYLKDKHLLVMETLLPGFWYLENEKFKNKQLKKKYKLVSTKLYAVYLAFSP